MLCTAESDTFCPQGPCFLRICRGICIGTHLHGSVFVCPSHNSAKLACYRGINSRNLPVINISSGTIQGNKISFTILFPCKGKLLIRLIHRNITASGYAACSHAAGYYSRMAGHAAADGQDTLRILHSLNIFRGCLQTYQNHFLSSCRPCFCILC